MQNATYSSRAVKGHEVRLVEGEDARGLRGRRVNLGSTGVAQDSRVDAAVERGGTGAGQGTDEVVVDVLVSGKLSVGALASGLA